MKKRGVLLLFLFILLISFVQADPPVLQTIIGAPVIEIEVPEHGVIKQNDNFIFNFHLFYTANGSLVTNATTDCTFFLINNSGNDILSANIPHVNSNVVNEWEINVLGGNFTSTGSYSYITQCNSTTGGGFINVGFDVTGSGANFEDGSPTFLFIAILFFMVLGSLFFSASLKAKKGQIKWSLIAGTFISFLIGLNLISVTIQDALLNPSLISLMDTLTAASFIMFWFVAGLMLVMWILTFFQTIMFNREAKRAAAFG